MESISSNIMIEIYLMYGEDVAEIVQYCAEQGSGHYAVKDIGLTVYIDAQEKIVRTIRLFTGRDLMYEAHSDGDQEHWSSRFA